MVANSAVTLWLTAAVNWHRNGSARGCFPASRYARIGQSAAHRQDRYRETPITTQILGYFLLAEFQALCTRVTVGLTVGWSVADMLKLIRSHRELC